MEFHEIWTLANVSLDASYQYDGGYTTKAGVYAYTPATSLTGSIYGTTSADASGAFQYEASWWRDTFNPPSHAICNHRGEPDSPNPVSVFWHPPKIIPPPA